MFSLIAAAALATAPSPIRHYIRSNRDGSSAENIVQYRPSRTEVAVYKWVEKCTTAALVTARMDPVRWEPRVLIAGKVGRDGAQDRIGELTLDPATRRLTAAANLPLGRFSDDAVMPRGLPWFLFDYDLADLNAYVQERKPRGDFRFAFALVWPEGRDFLTSMATVQASHRGLESRRGLRLRRFDLRFTGNRQGNGRLWLDAASGAIVEAEASLPNHPGMKDFRLRLARSERGSPASWQRLLRGHYGRCPA